jgi:Ribosomal protein L19E
MSLEYIKRLAAEVAGVGKSRIFIDPEEYDTLSTVISKDEVRKLMNQGIIRVLPKKD